MLHMLSHGYQKAGKSEHEKHWLTLQVAKPSTPHPTHKHSTLDITESKVM